MQISVTYWLSFFYHLDYTIGTDYRIPPLSRVADFTAGQEFHLASKNIYLILLQNNPAFVFCQIIRVNIFLNMG